VNNLHKNEKIKKKNMLIKKNLITKVFSMATSSNSNMLMDIKRITKHGITYPFGDDRSVFQAFPAGIPSKESDPFLMCDYFNMIESNGKAKNDDDFPIGWHPHRGFDIASYLKTGIGRHGDSLGNRESFNTPGMQWISVGSGVEHAEGTLRYVLCFFSISN
jgi:redox-sensitive bicupin YhaK (pirin superfamily)